MQGAEQLSMAVLKSGVSNLLIDFLMLYLQKTNTLDPQLVRQSPDMTNQLTGRKERLSWLIGFINENAVLYKVWHHYFSFWVVCRLTMRADVATEPAKACNGCREAIWSPSVVACP